LIVQVNHEIIETARIIFRVSARQNTVPTRERLIQSALFLFWERGFAGTSMADLLGHANVNSGSFYHFFESKEALLKAVLEEYLGGLGPQIVQPAFQQTSDPIERVFAILAGYRQRILMTNYQYGCPLGRLALEIDPENRPAHALIAQNFRGWIDAVRGCLEEAKDRLRAGTNLDALATYVLATMEGGVMLSRSYGSVEPFDHAVGQLRNYFKLLTTTAIEKKAATPKKMCASKG
jgi:TetR/AcrR family transcriptional regulator, transcriptional repressor for nem operon